MTALSPPMYTHEKNMVQFEEAAVHNEVASNRAGRAMFDRILRLHISVPGQKDVVSYEVDREYPDGHAHPTIGQVRKNETIYKRFGQYIEKYKANRDQQVMAGTPIEMWPQADVRMVATLKHLGIHTVEALAGLTDGNIQNLGIGGRELVRKAKAFLDSAANDAAASEALARNKVLQDQIDALKEQVAAFGEAFSVLNPDEQGKVKEALGRQGRKARAA